MLSLSTYFALTCILVLCLIAAAATTRAKLLPTLLYKLFSLAAVGLGLPSNPIQSKLNKISYRT